MSCAVVLLRTEAIAYCLEADDNIADRVYVCLSPTSPKNFLERVQVIKQAKQEVMHSDNKTLRRLDPPVKAVEADYKFLVLLDGATKASALGGTLGYAEL